MSSPIKSNQLVQNLPKLPTKPAPEDSLTTRIQSVYYVQAAAGAGVFGPICIRPTFTKTGVKWEDTGRARPEINTNRSHITFDGQPCTKFLHDSSYIPKHIEIEKANGKIVKFDLLTLQLFNDQAIDYVGNVNAMPKFTQENDVIDFYLNANFQN